AAAYYRERAAFKPARIEGRDARRNWQERLRAQLLELLGEPDVPPVAIEPESQMLGQTGGDKRTPGFSPHVEGPPIRSEPEVRLPLLLIHPASAEMTRQPPSSRAGRSPADPPDLRPAVVLLHPSGKSAWLEEAAPAGLLTAALDAGARVLLPDVRLRGEL